MISFPRFIRFVLIFVVLYSGLLAAWPVLGSAYAAIFRVTGNTILYVLDEADSASFAPTHLNDFRDTKLHLYKRLRIEGKMDDYNADKVVGSRFGYDPLVLVLSLILATPLALSRLLAAAGKGVLMVTGFAALRILLVITYMYQSVPHVGVALLPTTPFWDALVLGALHIFVIGIGGEFLIPALIWLAATLRASDWNRFLTTGFRNTPD